MTTTESLPRPSTAGSTPPPPPPPAPGRADGRVRDTFVRPRQGRRIAGVCAAVADHFGWDRTTVRLVALLSILLPGPQVLAYLIGWIVIPNEEDGAA